MLNYSIIFFILAIIAGLFGLADVSGTAAGIAQILFFLFLTVWIVSIILGRVWKRNA